MDRSIILEAFFGVLYLRQAKKKLNKMGAIKIINGKLVNEGCIEEKDILILNDRIEKISNSIQTSEMLRVLMLLEIYNQVY